MSEEKKIIMERMAEKFTQIPTEDRKNYAALCMTAYETGKAAGIKEECRRWEQRLAAMSAAM